MKGSRISFLISVLIATFIGACVNEQDAADLILVNGDFFTANQSAMNASAVAIRDGKFVKIRAIPNRGRRLMLGPYRFP